MSNKKLTPRFGISISPAVTDLQDAFERAEIADKQGIDLITIMDHPYNRRLFDTWTLLTALGQATERVEIAPNVLSLPLRPPAMLAKQAATLDVLTNGRLMMALGAGAFWDGIAAIGGPRRTPGEAYQAFEDAVHIMRGMWDNAEGSFTYQGEFYQVDRVKIGPTPTRRIPLYFGAYGPRMLRLLGQTGDGLFISYNYDNPEKLNYFNQRIDEGADMAGREPSKIRRGYNLMGMIDLGQGDVSPQGATKDSLVGKPEYWIEKIVEWYTDYRQDTFIFWPSGSSPIEQIKAYSQTIVPAVKQAVGAVD